MQTRLDIEGMLMGSLAEGTAVGIKIKDKGEVIATAVKRLEIRKDGQKWVELKPFTLYGFPIAETRFPFERIEAVLSFSVSYNDPVYVRLRKLRALVLGIT
jgi:hypothetical protein